MNSWQEHCETFGDLAHSAARRFGEREALVFEGRRYSFVEVAGEVDRAARGLIAMGIGRGDHVAHWLNNSADWIFIAIAATRIGAVLTPINTRFRTHDLAYVLKQSDAAALIAHDVSGPVDYLAMIEEVVARPEGGDAPADPEFPALRRILILGDRSADGVVLWSDALAAGAAVLEAEVRSRAHAVSPSDLALIMYTSGTTGFPKGAMHDSRSIRNVEERAYRMAMTPDDVIMAYLPFFHVFGFSECLMMGFLTGAKQIVMATFDPDEALDLVEREEATLIHGFEAHIKALVEAQDARPRRVERLRTGIFAAGPMSAVPILKRAARTFPTVRPVSGFGMTEVWIGAGFTSPLDEGEGRFEASGFPGLGYDMRVVNPETGEVLGEGVEGEIQVRGRYLMLGYYKKPDETAAAYTADGWFKTGDAGYWREDGALRLLGRYKDMLKVGGENVDPMEVEALLLDHPAVHQVAVVGQPDARLTEIPVAFVQLAQDAEAVEDDFIAYCRGKVASFKLPRAVRFIDEFPMTASGKIRKEDLRKSLQLASRPPST